MDQRWVLFDLDGTLFDYAAAETQAVIATLEDAGLEPDADVLASYRRINAQHWVALERGETTPDRLRLERWSDTLTEQGITDVDVEELAGGFLRHLAAGDQLIEGAVEVVSEVAERHPIAYVTNGLADVQRPRLDASPLGPYAELTVISDEIGVAKPHPEIFEAALRGLGDPPRSQVIMVGDNLVADIGGAANVGLETVWLADPTVADPARNEPQPTYRIAELRELLTLV